MAGLANKLGQGMPLLSANLMGSTKLLGVQSANSLVLKTSIHSKTSGNLEPRLKPWNYKKYGYNNFYRFLDNTTKRFDSNSKLIVIEGPPALEKGKVAKELADELDMLHIPNATMDDWYINKYGYDLRELDWQFENVRLKAFDEKTFAQDPTGQDGGLDRMQQALFYARILKYNEALTHIFNTGQGVVMEKSPFSDYVFMEACYQMGWTCKFSRKHFKNMWEQTWGFLRPNVIIYLDAPVDVVQAKIQARAKTTHPWEKNSPVYTNSAYMKLLYEDLLRNDYIPKAAIYSKVLTYDWSEGGETEIVVEDIERLQLDILEELYGTQQNDWALKKEDNYNIRREMFTQEDVRARIGSYPPPLDADRLAITVEQLKEFQEVALKLPGNRYSYGLNAELGDNIPMLQFFARKVPSTLYHVEETPVDQNKMNAYWEERERRRKAGDANWWNF